MTPRTRSQDLTADLLHDLQVEEAAPTAAARPAIVPPAPSLARAEPAPLVVTSLYLSPRGWRRPTVSRAGRSVTVSAGPVRLRIGHEPS